MHKQWLGGLRPQTDTVAVNIIVSKGTDPFVCEDNVRICGGMDTITGHVFPAAAYTLAAEYLKFTYDELDVIRILHAPIVPLDGDVGFPLTHHVFPAGDTTSTLDSTLAKPFATANRCLISAARVCAFDFDVHNMQINCTTTDAFGKYHIPVAQHTRVDVTVEWNDHTFALIQEGNIKPELITEEDVNGARVPIINIGSSKEDTRRIDYRDVTAQIIDLGAHGTRCRKPISNEAIFQMTVPKQSYPCFPSNEMTVVIPTTEMTHTRVMLPGHTIMATLDALEPAWPQITDSTDLGYFQRLGNRTRELRLREVSTKRIQAETSDTAEREPVLEYEYVRAQPRTAAHTAHTVPPRSRRLTATLPQHASPTVPMTRWCLCPAHHVHGRRLSLMVGSCINAGTTRRRAFACKCYRRSAAMQAAWAPAGASRQARMQVAQPSQQLTCSQNRTWSWRLVQNPSGSCRQGRSCKSVSMSTSRCHIRTELRRWYATGWSCKRTQNSRSLSNMSTSSGSVPERLRSSTKTAVPPRSKK